MDWTKLLSTQRFKPENGCIVPTVTASSEEGADALRTDFHIDYDRVVFPVVFAVSPVKRRFIRLPYMTIRIIV